MNKLMYCFMNDINYSMILKNKIYLLNLFIDNYKFKNKTNKRLHKLKPRIFNTMIFNIKIF